MESILTIVVLPAPLGPRTPKISPSLTCKVMPSRATILPCLLSNSRRQVLRFYSNLRLSVADDVSCPRRFENPAASTRH